MARLTMRDGTTIQVPDNATPDQVQLIVGEYGRQQRETSAQKGRESAWDETPTLDKLAIGFAKPFIETGKGIKSLFTDLNQDDRNELDAGKGVSGVAGAAGELAGNAAMFAVPGGLAADVGRGAAAMLPRTLQAARAVSAAVRAAPEVGAVSGMEALKAPTDDRSRADAAMQGAIGGGAGVGAGKVLTRALGGVAPSAAGRALLDAGVPATPGMVARGRVVPWIEQRMAAMPLVGGRVRQLQTDAVEKINERLATLRAKPMTVQNENQLESTLSAVLAVAGTMHNPSTALALLAARYALPTNVTRKLLTGHYKPQAAELARALRSVGATPAVAGAAASGSDD